MSTGAHTITHDLPISSGFSSSGGSITVYCGRCGGSYPADARWASRYLERVTGQLRREIDRGYTTRDHASRSLQEYVDRFTKSGLHVRVPTLE